MIEHRCAMCGELIPRGTGRRKFCERHCPPQHRATYRRRVERIEGRAGVERIERLWAEGETAIDHGSMSYELMAVALQVTDDPVRAAAIARISVSSPQAAIELAQEARAKCADLCEGKQEALGRWLRAMLQMALIRGMAKIDRLSASQAGHLISSIAKSLEVIVGTPQQVFGNITLQINEVQAPSLVVDLDGEVPAQRSVARP